MEKSYVLLTWVLPGDPTATHVIGPITDKAALEQIGKSEAEAYNAQQTGFGLAMSWMVLECEAVPV